MRPGARRNRRALVLFATIVVLASAGCRAQGSKLTRDQPSPKEKARSDAVAAAAGAVPQPEGAPLVGTEALVAQAKTGSVAIFDDPNAKAPTTQLANPNEDGAQRVFLIEARRGDWLHVLLPVRPNGSKGWIKASDVSIVSTLYRVRVEIGAHRITVVRGHDVITQEPIGVGKANTPTPGGAYYLTELLQPPDASGPYGPYAYGLSGFSDVVKEFRGGNGVVGIHGTNEPGLLGQDVSFGCIRMSNAGITKLAAVLPLGTPVEIVP